MRWGPSFRVCADAAVVQAGAGSQSITLDGEALTLKSYLIDDANYVKLRDLAQALGLRRSLR